MTRSALIVVDMLNPYRHDDAERLMSSVERVLPNLVRLIVWTRERGIPLVYVNDNFGDWRSSSEEIVNAALEGARPDLVDPVLPPDDASFVIKARHSIFYGTPLDHLCAQHGIEHLILAGQVTEQCILYSALDAFVRHYRVTVAADACAAIEPSLADAALEMMRTNMHAWTPSTATLTGGRADRPDQHAGERGPGGRDDMGPHDRLSDRPAA